MPAADGEDERVVGDRAVAGDDAVLVGVDLGDRCGDELGADARGERGQRVAAHVVARERLGGAQRSQLELAVGRDDRHADAVAGQVAQRERELDRGDAAAGDDDVRSGMREGRGG